MKKIVIVIFVVILLIVGYVKTALGEEAATPFYEEAMQEVKTYTTSGSIEGSWTLTFQKDETGFYPCKFNLGDDRIVTIPLSDEELNELLYKALGEDRQRQEEEDKNENRTWIACAWDWVTFWD